MIKFFKSIRHGRRQEAEQAGFTLLETLVAVAIFTLSILGIMSVLGSGISTTSYAKDKMAAAYLAQEGIECIRNTRDNYFLYTGTTGLDWDDFVSLDMASIGAFCPDSANPQFTRQLSKVVVSSNEMKIFSTVSWTQGSGSYQITFSENLFNWVE